MSDQPQKSESLREPQPGGIDFAPVYAAPSATERDAVVEPVAFHVKVKGWGEELCFTEDGAQSLVKRIRRTKGQHGVATITPLYATLPNEALERSEQATFDIAARLLKERDALAKALEAVRTWAEKRCPCENEQPNPCLLCGASVENLEACKAVDETFPRWLKAEINTALGGASHE